MTEIWKSRFLHIPKSAGSRLLLMSLVIDGLEVHLWNLVRLKAAREELHSPLMTGRCMPWEELAVRCNVFRHKALCTSVLSATQVVSCQHGKPNTLWQRTEKEEAGLRRLCIEGWGPLVVRLTMTEAPMEVLEVLELMELDPGSQATAAMMVQCTPTLALHVRTLLEDLEDTTAITTIMETRSKQTNGLKSAGISSTFRTETISEES